jgi:hypothetical protein
MRKKEKKNPTGKFILFGSTGLILPELYIQPFLLWLFWR